MRLFRLFLAIALCLAPIAVPAQKKPATLVIISVDGMKPEYATRADEHGLKVPVLRSFLKDGTYAEGVIGVIPTVTYPSHTTLVTGVWPAEHGVIDNTIFDPERIHPDVWYWDFQDIKVPTLYTQAKAAGLKTAAVSWPVTVGAPIDYLVAEGMQSEHTDTPSGSPYNPADIMTQLHVTRTRESYPDTAKTETAVGILHKFHPNLMLVHLTDLDHQEHQHGPFSPEANAAMEILDSQIGQIEKAALEVDPSARIAVVSDHGFMPIHHRVNLDVLLVQAGLITLKPEKAAALPKGESPVRFWQAAGWGANGSMAIVLRDPKDKVVLAKVKAILDKAAADPANGIAEVIAQPELTRRGGFPQASFLVDFKSGYQPGSALQEPLVVDSTDLGAHGYLPTHPEVRSTFMVKGSGVAAGRDLKIIDMRQIAPTFAQMLGITLPAAKLPPVAVKP
ncbi:MAG TPA: ectonucleotide pyrophosphatase/phosphodiesterase [Acidobacteriaceae bacterium]|jgi:predicted AlkP superfamily pyrophosphatase or phosphodiesterase